MGARVQVYFWENLGESSPERLVTSKIQEPTGPDRRAPALKDPQVLLGERGETPRPPGASVSGHPSRAADARRLHRAKGAGQRGRGLWGHTGPQCWAEQGELCVKHPMCWASPFRETGEWHPRVHGHQAWGQGLNSGLSVCPKHDSRPQGLVGVRKAKSREI